MFLSRVNCDFWQTLTPTLNTTLPQNTAVFCETGELRLSNVEPFSTGDVLSVMRRNLSSVVQCATTHWACASVCLSLAKSSV